MFILDKQKDKAVLTVYGYVGGYYLDYRNIAAALDDITRSQIKQVDFHLHTNGGSVFDGNLIYNFITNFKGTVDIYIDGIAASMGFVLMMAGDRVHIAENGFLMVHPPTGDGSGNARQLIETAKMLRSIETNVINKFAGKTGMSTDEIRNKYFDGLDHWIDADEAVTLGLVTDKFTAKKGTLTFTKADAMKQGLSGIFDKYTAAITQTPKTDLNMSKVTMKLKLADDAPEQEVVSAIEALEQRATAAETKLSAIEQKEKDGQKAAALVLVEDAIKEQRIGATAKEQWIKMFEDNFETAKSVLASVAKRQTAKEIVGGEKPVDEALLKMTWDQADKADKLYDLKAKYPDEFKARYKERFGKEFAG